MYSWLNLPQNYLRLLHFCVANFHSYCDQRLFTFNSLSEKKKVYCYEVDERGFKAVKTSFSLYLGKGVGVNTVPVQQA